MIQLVRCIRFTKFNFRARCLTLSYSTTSSELGIEKRNENCFITSPKKRKLLYPNDYFLLNLFTGDFDKRIFEYPDLLENSEIDAILNHSVEAENYIITSSKVDNFKITKDILRDLKKLHLLGLSVPQEYGGLGYSETQASFIHECSNINPTIGNLLANTDNLGIKIISEYGSEAQKSKYLPRLISGNSCISFACLEECPPVEINLYETTCILDHIKNEYILNGKKKWILHADLSDLFVVLAKGNIITDKNIIVNFKMFIIEKNTPGIKIYESKCEGAKDCKFFEIDFNDVHVSADNLIGNYTECAYPILRKCLSYSNLSSSVACLTELKKILYSAQSYCKNKTFKGEPLIDQSYIQGMLGHLTMYTYIVETLAYFVSNRFDSFVQPDLLLESCAAKVLSLELLYKAIQSYSAILGPECYKKPSVLESALKVHQFHLTFNENIIYLKLLIGSNGIYHATKNSQELRENVKKLRNPKFHPFHYIFYGVYNYKYKEKKIRSSYGLEGELHITLKKQANILEKCLSKLQLGVEKHLTDFGNEALLDDNHIITISEMATYIYALTACLARASHSFRHYVQNSAEEVEMVHTIANYFYVQLQSKYDEIITFTDFPHLNTYIGKINLKKKEYALAHPLTRSI